MKSHSGPSAVSWVITIIDTQTDRPDLPPFYKAHHRERAVPRKIFQALPGQTDTTVALISIIYGFPCILKINGLISHH
jgi:hypothetical protein